MKPHTTAVLAVAPLAALAIAAGAGPALAAPVNRNTHLINLGCSDGHDYLITLVEGAALGSAGHVVNDPSVLIPTAFQFHLTVVAPDGTVIDESTTPVQTVHGSSGSHLDTISCTFTQSETADLPGLGAVTIVLEGRVDAFRPKQA